MFNSRPADVLILDSDGIAVARFGKTPARPLASTSTVRLAGAFETAPVTPRLVSRAPITDSLRRLRSEGKLGDRAWVLLPDSWFRMNLIELDELPSDTEEAAEIVRWSIRRTLLLAPDTLRVGWVAVARDAGRRRLLVVSAVEETLGSLESALREAGVEPAGIEAIGLNLWNAVAHGETASSADRMLIHVRDGEFTTAVFRGDEPIFVRSRNLSGERSVENEIRLSASYLRDAVRLATLERCYVAANELDPGIEPLVKELFGLDATRVRLQDYITRAAQVRSRDSRPS